MAFVHTITSWLSSVEHMVPQPEDLTQIDHWEESVNELADELLETDEHHKVAEQIIEAYIRQHKRRLHHRHTAATQQTTPTDALQKHMKELCERPQVEQRTEAWYEQIKTILGASELDDIFASPRIRALLVMSKANPQPRPSQPLAVFSQRMSAFDWGIRFEPVVKQIYEHMYNAEIKELGRLICKDDPRMSASPDGLVYSGPRAGRLIEIKCPVTREPDGTISKKYYTQMQSQLFVTGLTMCDFVEAVFISPYSSEISRCGPGLFYGEILFIETMKEDFEAEYSYKYSPLNPTEPFNPELSPNDTVLERIPWCLYSWHEQIVRSDPHWWHKVKPVVNQFWEDVEKAKRGEFIVPESTRAPRAKKEQQCLIVIKEGV
jgi:hypothetical protein